MQRSASPLTPPRPCIKTANSKKLITKIVPCIPAEDHCIPPTPDLRKEKTSYTSLTLSPRCPQERRCTGPSASSGLPSCTLLSPFQAPKAHTHTHTTTLGPPQLPSLFLGYNLLHLHQIPPHQPKVGIQLRPKASMHYVPTECIPLGSELGSFSEMLCPQKRASRVRRSKKPTATPPPRQSQGSKVKG